MTQRWQDRGVGSRGWWLLLGVGVALMAAASLWAPPQPELVSGGACNIALCGTLEDPERWRNACWLWLAGAALALPATALGVRRSRAPRWPVLLGGLVAGLVVVPALLVSVAFLALMVSVVTSVHGAATTAVVCVVLPAVAAVSSWVRHAARRDQTEQPEVHNVGSWGDRAQV
jgi:NAD/NADP transhydrogenase beta subunit